MYSTYRAVTLVSYFLLIVTITLWAFIFGPEQVAAKAALALFINSGLLLVAYTLLKGTRRSYQWLCFILLFYFIGVVQALFSPSESLASSLIRWVSLVSIVVCFCSSMLAARFYQVQSSG